MRTVTLWWMVVFLVVVGEVQCSLNCGTATTSLQLDDRLVNVTYHNLWTDAATFRQCCEWVDEARNLNCSFHDSNPGFCLRVRSSTNSSYIVDGVNGCEIRADAPISLSLYLTNRSSVQASVQTRAECNDTSCRLTITSEEARFLTRVEWAGSYRSQDYEAGLSSIEVSRWFRLGRRALQGKEVVAQGDGQRGVYLLGVLMSLVGVSTLVALCAGKKEDESPAEFLDTVAILPPRYSYSKLQKATKNYSQKLGDGAFGSVYEGTLPNGTRVAVKMLEKASVQGEKQFRAEVASMGAIRHLNLVRLHGFCSEGSHRLLVYEYMPNGSLDSWLFGKKNVGTTEKLLDWEQRLNIALGTARALAYLHEECSDHIIHLDVKPENILLDHQFCPKELLTFSLFRSSCLSFITCTFSHAL